jgi:hypothetical protein
MVDAFPPLLLSGPNKPSRYKLVHRPTKPKAECEAMPCPLKAGRETARPAWSVRSIDQDIYQRWDAQAQARKTVNSPAGAAVHRHAHHEKPSSTASGALQDHHNVDVHRHFSFNNHLLLITQLYMQTHC